MCRPLGKAHAVVAVLDLVGVLLLEVQLTKMREQPEDKPRVPLKTILQNFLNHVDSLESRKRARDDAYEQEFQVFDNCPNIDRRSPCVVKSQGPESDFNTFLTLCCLHFVST